MSRRIIFAPAAVTELKAIFKFSVQNWFSVQDWGERRASDYLDHLKTQIWTLSEQPQMGVDRAELMPRLRILSVGHTSFFIGWIQMQFQSFVRCMVDRIPAVTSD